MYKQAILFAKLKSIGEGEDKRLTLDIDYPQDRLGELGLDFAVNDKSYHSEGGGSIPYIASLDGVEVVARVTLPEEFEYKVKKHEGYASDTLPLPTILKNDYLLKFNRVKSDEVLPEKEGVIEYYKGADKDEPLNFCNL